jgi:hypothetical protein
MEAGATEVGAIAVGGTEVGGIEDGAMVVTGAAIRRVRVVERVWLEGRPLQLGKAEPISGSATTILALPLLQSAVSDGGPAAS